MNTQILFCVLFSFLFSSSLPVTAQTAVDMRDDCQPPCNVGDRPACELTWAPHVSAVFLGSVIDVKREEVPIILNGKQEKTLRQTVSVRVEESYIGIEDKTVTVISGGDLCGYDFDKGERYLIYAKYHSDKSYFVTRCGGTKKVNRAEGDLKYLRALSTEPQSAKVFGTVFRFEQPSRDDLKIIRKASPWKGGKVIIKGDSQTLTAVVEQNGGYHATGLEPGTYMVDIQADEPSEVKTSAGFTWRDIPSKGQEVTVHAKGCVKVDFLIDPFAKSLPLNGKK